MGGRGAAQDKTKKRKNGKVASSDDLDERDHAIIDTLVAQKSDTGAGADDTLTIVAGGKPRPREFLDNAFDTFSKVTNLIPEAARGSMNVAVKQVNWSRVVQYVSTLDVELWHSKKGGKKKDGQAALEDEDGGKKKVLVFSKVAEDIVTNLFQGYKHLIQRPAPVLRQTRLQEATSTSDGCWVGKATCLVIYGPGSPSPGGFEALLSWFTRYGPPDCPDRGAATEDAPHSSQLSQGEWKKGDRGREGRRIRKN